MSGHTKGPWLVSAVTQTEVIASQHSRTICRAHRDAPTRTEAETRANARLIAAAPDLLVALITASELVGDAFHGKVGAAQALDAIDDVAKAAIAKACGASS